MRIISTIMNFYWSHLISLAHLKVAQARNFRHFDFFFGAILLPFKNCPMVVLISLAEL